MKLMYKINLVALVVLVAVGLAIGAAGVSTIRQVIYDLNREVMSREVDNVVASIHSAYMVLKKNQLDSVESYKRQAQADILFELKNYRYRETGRLIIVTDQQKVIKHHRLAVGQPVDIAHAAAMVRDRNGSMEFLYRDQQQFFSYKLFPQWNWLVILSVSSDEMLVARSQFMGKVIVILLISLVIGALVVIWFVRRVVGPIRQLADATAYVSEGKWDAPLPHPKGSDEVAQLTAAFRRMAGRLAEMYGRLESNLQKIEQSQGALRESEEKYRGLVELLPLVVFETDAQGRFVFANRNILDTFGYSEEDIARSVFLQNLTIGEDQEGLETDMASILEGEDLGMMEYTGRHSDGSTFPCIALATAIFQNHKAVGIRGIIIDITERKSLENELRQAQEFLDTILNNVADPIFVKDDQHRYVLLNDAFYRFMGQPRDNMIGKTEHDFFPPQEAERFWEQDDLVFSSQKPRGKEDVVTGADGKQHVILTQRTFFKDSSGTALLVGIIKDITQRKEMEQELFKIEKLESIGVLAGGIAHDFNNILTAIIGNLSLAKRLTDPDSVIHHHLAASNEASLQAKDLTQQLLTFARGGAPVKQTVSLAKLIEESATFILRGSNVRCNFEIAANLWTADVDTNQISRVIHNIMVNASEAMPSGGTVRVVADNCRIQSSSPIPLQAGRYVRLEVKDFGIGIPPETLSDIFDPYFTTKEDGSGLGLATAFSIIKRHDGHISVESAPNAGATFSIYLPATDKTVVPEPKTQTAIYPGHGRILVMDDEDMVREVVGAMLKALGYTFEFADDGAQAIEKYKKAYGSKYPFDLVIMDLTIPGGMGGQKAIKKLLTFDPGTKSIVASGYSDDPVMADFKKFGFTGMITKPFELNNLSQVLHQVLGKQPV